MKNALRLVLLLALSLHAATPAAEPVDYVRYEEHKTEALLETAVVQMKHTSGATVDLIGAVHVADKAYYTELNTLFRSYNAVLYEMVGGPVTARAKAQAPGSQANSLSWVSGLHSVVQKSLGLASQLAEIDYSLPQMVHADVSLQQFQKLKEQKQESFLGLFLRAYQTQQELLSQGKPVGMSGPQLLSLLAGGGKQAEMKRAVAQQFDSVELLMTGMEGEQGTVIIGERNATALRVLEAQLKLGKKRLALFYGAAHLPDLQARLEKLGWQLSGEVQWLTAWKMTLAD